MAHILLVLVKGNQIIAHEHILSVEGAENLQQIKVENINTRTVIINILFQFKLGHRMILKIG